MPASSQRRRHGEGATITCHPRRRARPALPGEGEELHVRPVPRRAARGLVPARCDAGGAQGRGGTGRHLRKRAAPNVQYSRFEAPITLQSRSPFFLTFSRHGVLLKERTASIRGCRDLLATLTTAGSPSTRRAWGRAPYIRRGRPRRHRRDTSCRSRKRAELEVTTTTTLRAPPRQGPRRRRTRPQIARAAISNTPPAHLNAPCPPTPQTEAKRRPCLKT